MKKAEFSPFLLSLAIGILAAIFCVWLRTPLPWMIGPLFSTAIAGMAGVKLHTPVQARQAGQWAIGTALGLYFTPAVLAILASYLGFIALAVGFALLLGMVSGRILHCLSGVDKTTAFFAMAVGGASEMASQGERYGAAVDRVAAAHSLRIMLVVAVIPLACQMWGVQGLAADIPGALAVDYPGLILLVAMTGMAALCLVKCQWPNAWVIGPLLVTIGLTASSLHFSALPEWMVHLGQLFIGLSLGTRFTPAFLATAPRYLASVVFCCIIAIMLAACFGLGLAWASGMHPVTAILATSPGGIAEMSLTAKSLQLGVPVVTAFHVIRMAVLVISIGPLFQLIKRYWN